MIWPSVYVLVMEWHGGWSPSLTFEAATTDTVVARNISVMVLLPPRDNVRAHMFVCRACLCACVLLCVRVFWLVCVCAC